MGQPEWDKAWNDGIPDDMLVKALEEEEARQVGDGGAVAGHFKFHLEPVVNWQSEWLGVQERVFQPRVWQVGSLGPGQNVVETLAQGLRAAMECLLDDEDIEDRDHVFFTLESNRLVNSYNSWGLRAGE